MNLGALLGVDASELLKAKGTAEGIAADLRAIRRALEAAAGVPNEDAVPPVRARVPYIEVVKWDRDLAILAAKPEYTTGPGAPESVPIDFNPGDGRRQTVDLEVVTGAPSMNGTLTNLGDSLVLVRYLGARDEWSRYAELPPGATIEHVWATRRIDLVSLGHQAGKVQVIAR